MKFRYGLYAMAVLLLGGCASIIEGTDQHLTVSLTPKEAVCEVTRKGVPIGTVSDANHTLNVAKSRNDLTFVCNAPGYRERIVKIESSASGWGIASCLLVDLCITDYSTGALNKYPTNLTIVLSPS